MKRIFSSTVTFLTIFLAVLCLLTSCEKKTPFKYNYTPAEIPEQEDKNDPDRLRILFIGNSFTVDAVYYLPQVLSACGVKNWSLANIYYPGRTLPEYVSNFDTAEYTLYTAESGWSTWTTSSSKVSISQIASGDRWDIVTLQEHTGNYLGWSWSETEESTIRNLIAKIDATQKVKPKYYWMLTQAYYYMSKIGTGSRPYITWPFENTREAQLQMYDVIVKQGQKVMDKFPFDGIVPTGTMLQNLRTCAFNNNGWDQTRDGYHMEMGTARFGAACTVAESIIVPIRKFNLDACRFRIPGYSIVEGSVCTPVTDATAPVVIQAARYAVAKPFEITDMSDVVVEGYNDQGGQTDVNLKGSGTEAAPYLVGTAKELAAMSSRLVAGECRHFRQTADIDMSGVTAWTPTCRFLEGKSMGFDGDGHLISNFKCPQGTSASLFGTLSGYVRNLRFKDCEVSNPGVCALLACICGDGDKSAVIENVHAEGCRVTQTDKSVSADCGGLCASAGNTVFRNCSFSGYVTNNNNTTGRTGGILGAVNADVTMEKCWADVRVCVEKSPSGYGTGGIVGGPVAGKSLIVKNCYSKGAFTGNGGYLGGIAGELASDCTVENCYSTMTISGDYSLGGITGRIVNLTNPNSHSTWNVDIHNTVSGCIAWMGSIVSNASSKKTPNKAYSSGAICAFTVFKNTLKNCWRRPGLMLDVYGSPFESCNTTFDQEDCGPDNPYVKAGEETYYMPYHGKVANSGESLSAVARRIGWSEEIWDLSGSEPRLR